jgi:ribosome biogenesis GTPase / thiamine phosphate phosphatase
MMQITGRVIEEQKNYFVVDTTLGSVQVTTKGVLKKDKKRVCVGDMADIEVIDKDHLIGIIHRIHERTSYLKRPSIANLSRVFLISAWKEPLLDLEGVDRFLVNASLHHFTPVIVFNKIDLLLEDERSEFDSLISWYRKMGYRVLTLSALTGEHIEGLLAECSGHLSVFAGLSGVGKSHLLSRIFPGHDFRIGEVSGTTGRGTHTTTSVVLLPLPEGRGYIADTPGFSFVELPLVPEEDVVTFFPELERQIGTCRFNNCLHDNEPGCNVRALVEQGEIAPWRLEHYLKIYREMKERRRGYKEQ